MMRVVPSAILFAALLFLLSTAVEAQQRFSIDNSTYGYRVEDTPDGPVCVIDGYMRTKHDALTVPSRLLTREWSDGAAMSYRVANARLSEPFRATPFSVMQFTRTSDTTYDSQLLPAAKPWPAAALPAELPQRVYRRGGRLLCDLTVPLVTYDAATGETRWIESLDIEAVSRPGMMPDITEEGKAPYSSMRFVQYSGRDLDTSGAWMDVQAQSVRFFLNADGLVKITREWLQQAGVNPSTVDPARLQVYHKGQRVPMYARGMDDGSIDDGDAFVFRGHRNYGGKYLEPVTDFNEPYKQYLDMYSDSTAYWLLLNDAQPLRAAAKPYTGAVPTDTLNWAYDLVHIEADNALSHASADVVRSESTDWTSEDTWHIGWFWAGQTANYAFNAPGLVPGKTVRARGKTLGWSGEFIGMGLRVNSLPELAADTFRVGEQSLLTGTFPSEQLRGGSEGKDTVRLFQYVLPTGGSGAVVDWLDIEYPRLLEAEADRADFLIDAASGSDARLLHLRGFSGSDVVVLRLENGQAQLPQFSMTQRDGSWHCAIPDTLRAGVRYAAGLLGSIPEPGRGQLRQLKQLVTPDNGAPYLIITAAELLPATLQYASFIENSYGIGTRVVTVEEIYDRYAYGHFQPDCIKLFLYDAYHSWTQDSLKYVLFMGDGNYNYKLTSGEYSKNYVPSHGWPVSDIWYVCFDEQEARPSISIGRLPVSSPDMINRYRERHENYLQLPFDLWNKTTIHFSGGNAAAGESDLRPYRQANQQVIDIIEQEPFTARTRHFYKTLDPPTEYGPKPLDQVLREVREGSVAISYIGHSGTQTWDNSISDPDQLASTSGRPAMITDFGCSTGKWAEPNIHCFAERFVVEDKSHSIGYIGNSAAGFVNTTVLQPRLFYSRIVSEAGLSIGDAHRVSKRELYDANNHILHKIAVRCNTLIGDPVVRLAFPEKVNAVIENGWVTPVQDIVTDVMDSISFRIATGNYGLSTADSLDVLIENTFNGTQQFQVELRIGLPAVIDTFTYSFPSGKIAGDGQLRVLLDPHNRLDEISKSDNETVRPYQVLSTFLKLTDVRLTRSSGEGRAITVLNPTVSVGDVDNVRAEFSLDPQFGTVTTRDADYGRAISVFDDLPTLDPLNKHYWRVKLDAPDQDFAGPYAFWPGLSGLFAQRDSAELSTAQVSRLRVSGGRITTLQGQRWIHCESAGFSDGKYAKIQLDGASVLGSSFIRGYNCAVFDSISLDVKRTGQYDTYGSAAMRDSLINFVNSVQPGEIIAIAAADEPQTGSNLFLDIMRSIGSAMIDSVRRFRASSWAIIGWKGAAIGTVPEGFTRPLGGPVALDTSFTVLPDTGTVVSVPIEKATAWKSAQLQRSSTAETRIDVDIVGVHPQDGETVLFSVSNPETIDLSGIDASTYPGLRLAATLYPSFGGTEPYISAWAVDFDPLPELALNYQSVAVTPDSLDQGDDLELDLAVVNAGGGEARPFTVHADLIGPDNIPKNIATIPVRALPAGEWLDTTIAINSSPLVGAYRVLVTADRANEVEEQYEENNAAIVRFYSVRDTSRPSLDVTFDGFPVMDGDYVRSTPELALLLNSTSPVPVTSPDQFMVTLDGQRVDLDSIQHSFTPAAEGTPARLTLYPVLEDGIYVWTFNALDGNGMLALDEPMEVLVVVESENRLTSLYNFPNPFSDETSFTFRLTGADTPEEVEVKIYTVAGRLIRTLAYPRSSLRVGYNALRWEGRDAEGNALANGVYFYKFIVRFNNQTFEEIGRMAVLR